AFVSCQNEYSLLARGIEAELLPAIATYGLGLLAYSPLGAGMLTGKYRRDAGEPREGRLAGPGFFRDKFLTPGNFDRVEHLLRIAERHGLAMVELALGWLAAKPSVASVVAAASSVEQLGANAAAI